MNLTPEEQFRIHGRIEGDACIELLDAAIKADVLSDNAFGDVKASFPDEDFLQKTIKEISHIETLVEILLKNTRGANRALANDIAAALDRLHADVEALELNVFNSTEYGLSEIQNIEKAMK